MGGGSGSGVHWGGGSGNGNGGGNGNSSGGGNNSSVAAPVAFGFPALAAPGAGTLGIAVSGEALSAAIADIFAALKGPFKFSAWGIALYGILPAEIAKDDPNMMSKIVTSLPAETVTDAQVSSLPLDQATVSVTKRVTDVVKDERQHIAVVSGVPMSVPVVDAKPTNTPGVFSASFPGVPSLTVSTVNDAPVSTSLPAGVTEDKDRTAFPAGFTFGGGSHEAIIRFPADSGQKPVYVSVTDVLTPEQVKQRQDEDSRRQQEWDARHPVEVAEREYESAKAELEAENKKVQSFQATLDGLKNTPEGLALSDAGQHPLTSSESRFVAVPGYSGGGVHFDATATVDSRDRLNNLINMGATAYVNNVLELGDVSAPTEDGVKVGNAIKNATIEVYDKLRQRLLDRQNEINNAQASLNAAVESRNQKEENKRDAEGKLNDELEKNKGKIPDLKIDQKIRDQMPERGWTEDDIKNTVSNGATGTSFDKRSPKKTPPDYLGRNDPATVYGSPGKYVVVNDRTGEVTQISDKTDPGWVDDSRIQWGNKNG